MLSMKANTRRIKKGIDLFTKPIWLIAQIKFDLCVSTYLLMTSNHCLTTISLVGMVNKV